MLRGVDWARVVQGRSMLRPYGHNSRMQDLRGLLWAGAQGCADRITFAHDNRRNARDL